MRNESIDALLKLADLLPMAVCSCSLRERNSGHLSDCLAPDLNDAVNELRRELSQESIEQDALRSNTRNQRPA